MSAMEAAVLIALAMLPFHVLLQWQLSRLTDPGVIRREGVVILKEEILEAHSEPIANYFGHEIWGTVTFMGMVYRFDRVAGSRYRAHVRERELYLDPGLVYVTD
jgi:hypothetical protein